MNKNNNRPTNRFKKERLHKINSEVRFPEVRLIGMGEPKVMSSFEAAKIAQSEGKDLILINESQNPPIVRIEDYNKFIYDAEKANKEKKKNAIKSQIKEIQLSPDIADNDLNTKARKAKEFLNDSDKVKVVLSMMGRQRQNPERAELTMLKFISLLEDCGSPEALPKLEGNKWFAMLKPKK